MRIFRPIAVIFIIFFTVSPSFAGQRLLRDADMEYALRRVAAPVLSAAGLSVSQVKILVIDDSSLNAFVADTRHIFIHSGLLLKIESATQLQAVLAHEAAHIANGHITRRLSNMRSARSAARLGLILAAAAGVASRDGRAALGIAAGTQGSARRLFLSHTRAEEASADASSVRYLSRAGVDPAGAIEVQELFVDQEALALSRRDPYSLTHPLSRERLRALKGHVAALPEGGRDAQAQYWYARARGKLSAFKRAPRWTLRRLKDSPTRDIALMREAVARHRKSDLKGALKAIDGALSLRPRDPYLMDLKGQILFESRRFSAAVQVWQRAVTLAPREALIQGGLGRALLAMGDERAALKSLEAARGRDFSDARILRDLAVAHAKLGQNGLASVATAERYALQGRLEDAAIHAKRAEALLPRGSSAWQRAIDVLSAAKDAQRR